MGAWIEICHQQADLKLAIVAPLVGAWIEIMLNSSFSTASKSLLSWERGLKYELVNGLAEGISRSSRGSVD